MSFTTARILAPTFKKMWNIYICEKKKSPCRVLNWFWLICHILSHKNINYAILYYSNLQLTAYNAYISLQITTNLMVKHIARSHFLGHCGQEVLLRQTAISPRQPHASETQISKLNSAETNPVFFHTPEKDIFICHAILFKHVPNLFLSEKSLRMEGMVFQLPSVIHNYC